jgi:CHAT domain-containing protein
MHKALTQFFGAFIVTVVLLTASHSLALARVAGSGSERHSSDRASQAEALFRNALRLSDSQDSKPARQEMQEAIRIWLQIPEAEKAAAALVQIGDHCKQARKYPDALWYYRQALDLQSLPRALRATALNAIGLIYAGLYVRDLAVHYLNKALEQADIIDDLSAQTIALTGLGDICRRKGDLAQSLIFITKAELLREKKHAEADPALLYLKGRVSQEQGLVDSAKGSLEEALVIYRNTNEVQGQVRALCALSTLSLFVSREQVALQQAEQARELADQEGKSAVTEGDHLNALELRWHAWLSCARAERALGLNERALKSYYLATACFDGAWIGFYLVAETSSVLFKEEAQAAYREYVDLLMEQGQFKEACRLADRTLARTLLNFTGARRARPRSEDGKQAATLRLLSRSIFRSRLQLLASGLSRAQRAKAQKDLEDFQDKLEETRLQTEMEHIKDRWTGWPKLITPEELQEKMAQDQMSLAEFHLGEKRSFVWLFTRGEFSFAVLQSRKEIENAVKPYLDLLATPPNRLNGERDLAKLRGQSEALFSKLFGSLSSEIERAERLIIVPDGLLHYLPFEALIQNGRYLVEDHEISYSPSASVLVQSQDSAGRAETGDRMELLAFGDPVFGQKTKASVTRKGVAKNAVSRKGVTRTVGSRKARRRPIDVIRDARTSRGFQLPPLPRTRDEVEYIASLFPADRTRLYLGKDSTEAVVKRESLRRYRRLHFATHSLIDEVSPSRSAVVLTLNDNPEEDGFLEVDEISDLDLDCDLVVLSACQTGRGQLLLGEGIVGLSRAFLYAGARSVVVSLWSVSDISTGHLMKSFYEHLAGNLGNAASLRLAKLQMLHGATVTRHAYYWAPFITVGKP